MVPLNSTKMNCGAILHLSYKSLKISVYNGNNDRPLTVAAWMVLVLIMQKYKAGQLLDADDCSSAEKLIKMT